MVTCGQLLIEQLYNYTKMAQNFNMSPSTLAGYKRVIKGQLIPKFGEIKIGDIGAAQIREWIKSLDLTRKTITNYLIPLRSMFDDAINDDIIAENPFDKVALDKLLRINGRKSEYAVEPFNTIERNKLIDAASGEVRNLIRFGFWSGLRPSEIIALKWADVDFKNHKLTVVRSKVCKVEKGTKTKAGTRKIDLHINAESALMHQMNYARDLYVFHNPNTSTQWSSSDKVALHWFKLFKGLDVTYRNMYQMRHTYASMMLTEGKSVLWLTKQMGHATSEMIFRHYARFIEND